VMATLRVEVQCLTASAVVFGVAAEGAANQFEMTVEPHRLAVHLADEGSFTTAHHA
nr:hypothetical protein [Pseudomonas sp.]